MKIKVHQVETRKKEKVGTRKEPTVSDLLARIEKLEKEVEQLRSASKEVREPKKK